MRFRSACGVAQRRSIIGANRLTTLQFGTVSKDAVWLTSAKSSKGFAASINQTVLAQSHQPYSATGSRYVRLLLSDGIRISKVRFLFLLFFYYYLFTSLIYCVTIITQNVAKTTILGVYYEKC